MGGRLPAGFPLQALDLGGGVPFIIGVDPAASSLGGEPTLLLGLKTAQLLRFHGILTGMISNADKPAVPTLRWA